MSPWLPSLVNHPNVSTLAIISNRQQNLLKSTCTGVDLGGGCRGCAPPPPEITCSFLIRLVFTSGHQSVTPFLSGAPPPKKIARTAPGVDLTCLNLTADKIFEETFIFQQIWSCLFSCAKLIHDTRQFVDSSLMIVVANKSECYASLK